MTLFEQLTQSPEALAKWYAKTIPCDICVYWGGCQEEPTAEVCAKYILEKLNEQVK